MIGIKKAFESQIGVGDSKGFLTAGSLAGGNYKAIGRPSSAGKPYGGLAYPIPTQDHDWNNLPSERQRHVSMHKNLPSDIQARIDIGRDRIARGLAGPSVAELTQFEDLHRMPSKANASEAKATIKPILKVVSTTSQQIETVERNPILRWSEKKVEPRRVLAALERPLSDTHQTIGNRIKTEDILAIHERDQMDIQERDNLRDLIHTGNEISDDLGVFEEPLRNISIYASTGIILGGWLHDLPIVVVTCVEELYRTGMYQANLFRTLPNRTRLLELIEIFDTSRSPPGNKLRLRLNNNVDIGFGSNVTLHLESTPDICALLSTYISSLPEPIFLPSLFHATWEWCVHDNDVDHTHGPQPQEMVRRHISSIPLYKTYTNPGEFARIRIAQLMLHLLPSPNFSLLVYLLAFFSQVVMISDENGVSVDDLGRMFGTKLFGGLNTKKEGHTMMCWFLRRWGPISDGLFEMAEEMRTHFKPGAEVDNQSYTRLDSSPSQLFRSPGMDSASPSKKSPLAIGSENSTDKDKAQQSDPIDFGEAIKQRFRNANLGQTDEKSGDYFGCYRDHEPKIPIRLVENEKRLEVQHIDRNIAEIKGEIVQESDLRKLSSSQESDKTSIFSASALEERLLDVSMPPALNDLQSPNRLETITSRDCLGDDIALEVMKDRQKISDLESQLKERDKMLMKSVQEWFSVRTLVVNLERRICELEVAEKKRSPVQL